MEHESTEANNGAPTPEHEMTDSQAVGRSIEVPATPDEIKALDALGPESEEVQKWLSEHGVTENDRIVANGNVYVASSEDFLTRDVAATEAWADVARSMVDVDRHSEEIAEEEPRITHEQAEEIGEITLESADIDEPMPEESGEDAHRVAMEERELAEHADELRTAFSEAINHLEMDGQSVELGQRVIPQGIKDSILQLQSALRGYDNYPTDAMRTILKRTVDGLHAVRGAAKRYTEGSIADVLNGVSRAEKAFESKSTIEGIPTSDIAQDLDALELAKRDLSETSELVDETQVRVLQQSIQQLEEIMQSSYSRPINEADLQSVVSRLDQLSADGGELSESIRKGGKAVAALTQSLRDARARLPGAED